MKVYPIGYSRPGTDTRIAFLMEDPNTDLVDCRFNPHSWQFEWCKAALMQKYGDRYHWSGPWLGNAKHPSNQRTSGPVEIDLIDPRTGIAGLVYYLRRSKDLILLCQCAEYQHCHLKEIVRRLVLAMPAVEVVLSEPTPPREEEKPQEVHKFADGAKVYARLKGSTVKTPAIVLESRWSPEGNYDEVRLRIAQYNELTKKWMISDYPKPLQSYRLTHRATVVPGLDETND